MALAPGTRLGPYEIVAPLGSGGMGEVWRARDTRLDRAVAIKILPADLSADPRQQVSVDGGWNPPWNPSGRELFFVSPPTAGGPNRMMVVTVRLEPTLALGRPQPLFEDSDNRMAFACIPIRCYAVAPDGQSFYTTQIPPASSPPPVTQIHLATNWLEDLKAKVPSRSGH